MAETTGKPRILFLTNEEYGQASVHITVSSTLVERYGDAVDVHICSMGRVAARVPEHVTFHKIDGLGMIPQYILNQELKSPGLRPPTGGDLGHRPSFLGTFASRFRMKSVLFPWSDAEYVRIARDTERVIIDVRPDLVVIDQICFWGMDACSRLDVRAITLSPVSWGMNVRVSQDKRNKPNLLRWPSLGTAYPNPLPWYLIPLNLFQALTFIIWMLVLSPSMRRLNRTRLEAGYTTRNPLSCAPKPVICPGTIALDFANGVPTPNIIPVGPLMQAYPPIGDIDPALHAWMEKGGKGKTILIVLGSHFRFDEREVRAMMSALEDVLSVRRDLQVLWKLVPYDAHEGAKADLEAMQVRMQGRVKVVDWLEVDPPALLQSGYVGAFVHHGGGNSYHEALGTGVPQIIISGWLDCHDFAQRAIEAGVGVWANKAEAPTICAPSVCSALIQVVGTDPNDPSATSYARRAAEAALITRRADTMTRVPGSGEELQVVRIARKLASLSDVSAHGGRNGEGEGDGLVHGRDVAAEWIYRLAASDLDTKDVCD